MQADPASVLGRENVVRGPAHSLRVAGGLPEWVVSPGSRDEVAGLVRLAADQGLALVPFGGRTWLDYGRPPSRPFWGLGTERLDRVVDYQPDDLTVTVEPGVTLATLQALLGERGQFLPLDPPLPERATAGGTVAAGASGPLRAGFGTPRDWVIGCRVLDAGGLEVRGGGQVVKNVAGYDLPKLYTGSCGTLGILTEVTFKVFPIPGAAEYWRIQVPDPQRAEELLAGIRDSDLEPAVTELVLPGRGSEVLVGFMHVAEALEWQGRRLAELATERDLRSERADATVEAHLRHSRDLPALAPFCVLISTLPGKVTQVAWELASGARAAGSQYFITARAATGQVFLGQEDASPPQMEAIHGLACELGARLIFPRLPRRLRELDPGPSVGTAAPLLRAMKKALDPQDLFSPGRFAWM